MVTTVVAPGLGPLYSTGTAAVTTAAAPAAIVEAAERAFDAGGAAVLLVESARLPEVERACALASAALGGAHVARLRVDLPPLAASLLAEQLGWLGTVLPDPGRVFACASRLAAGLLAAAWTREVAKLEHPTPTLGQHLRSLVPGAAFLATVHPEPGVFAAASGVLRTAGWHQQVPMTVLLSGDDDGRAWLRSVELPGLQVAHVLDVEPSPLAKSYYGTDRVCEIVGTGTDLQKLVRDAADARVRPCRWCGVELAGGPCPFCGSRLAAAVG
jgi:hypothetical protein